MAYAQGEDGDAITAAERSFEPPTQPITNFPLPRELRDEVYAYLLNAVRVEETAEKCESLGLGHDEKPRNGAAFGGLRKTYKFTTGIMAVNKTIGGEARDYFVRFNRFVRVVFDFAGFQHLRAMMDLPIIATLGKDARMAQDCLSIKIVWPGKSARITKNIQHLDNDKGVAVISLNSLPKLCGIVHFLCLIEQPMVPWVASAPDEKLSLLWPSDRSLTKKQTSLQIRIEARNNRFLQGMGLSATDQQFTLDSVQGIRCAGYDLSVAGFGTHAETLQAKVSMSPAIIFPAPFLLDSMSSMLRMKSLADDLITSGHSPTAHNRYLALVKWHGSYLKGVDRIIKMLDSFTPSAGDALRLYFRLLLSLRVDLLCSLLALAILHSAAEDAEHSLLDLHNGQPHMTDRMLSLFVHLSCISYLEHLPDAQMSASRNLAISKIALEKLESLPVKDEWIMHDIGVLQEFIDASDDGDTTEDKVSQALGAVKLCEDGTNDPKEAKQQQDEHEIPPTQGNGEQAAKNASAAPPKNLKDLLPQLSLWSMPFRFYSFADDPDLPKMPSGDGFVRWEDRAHMAKFTSRDKAALHDAQKKMGLPLSKFE